MAINHNHEFIIGLFMVQVRFFLLIRWQRMLFPVLILIVAILAIRAIFAIRAHFLSRPSTLLPLTPSLLAVFSVFPSSLT